MEDMKKSLFALLDAGKFQELMAMCPDTFSWAGLHNRSGLTPLQRVVELIMPPGTGEKREDINDLCEIASWLMARGASPHHKGTDEAPSMSWPKCNGRGDIEMHVKKQTAISSLTKLKVLLASDDSDDSDNSDDEDDSASECDWLQERVGLDKMLETFVSQTPRSDPRVAVDEGLLNFWEGLLRNESSHDVVLETAQGSVGAHRLVLSGASSVLSAMLSSDMTEGREQRIQCTDATKESMLLLLDLMYTGSTTAEAIRLDGAVGAFELAHRWEIQHVLPMLERLLAGELSDANF